MPSMRLASRSSLSRSGKVIEIFSYALTGWLLRLLRGDNRSLAWVTTVRVGLVMWGLGSLLPASPAEGIALSVSELGRRGVQRGAVNVGCKQAQVQRATRRCDGRQPARQR